MYKTGDKVKLIKSNNPLISVGQVLEVINVYTKDKDMSCRSERGCISMHDFINVESIKPEPIVANDGFHCDCDCPYLITSNDANSVEATCAIDGSDIDFYDSYLANCMAEPIETKE